LHGVWKGLISLGTAAALALGGIVPLAASAQTRPAPNLDFLAPYHAFPLVRPLSGPHSGPLQPGFSPAQIRQAYNLPALPTRYDGSGETIAIVDAYGDATIQSDLAAFDQEFNLPTPTLTIVGKNVNGCCNWDLETALDVEWAHAMAPGAKIVLEATKDNTFKSLFMGIIDAYTNQGATVISNSWGGNEFSQETQADQYLVAPGVTFLASSGDSGHGAFYPAASPNIVSVGGTHLVLSPRSETAWSGSSGGLSTYEPEPSWQQGVQQSGKRSIPDIAYDADPITGVAVNLHGSWLEVGGTSVGSPNWAGIVAVINQVRQQKHLPTLSALDADVYAIGGNSTQYARDFYDITQGSNGSCGQQCQAGPGYDLVTGWGSPNATNLGKDLLKDPN